jgi:hypothetical protein
MKLTYQPSAGRHDHLIYDEEDPSGKTLALTYGPDSIYLAERIVKAVNHHDELVAALKLSLVVLDKAAWFNSDNLPFWKEGGEGYSALIAARTALAKLRGGAK